MRQAWTAGLIAGGLSGLSLSILIVVGSFINLRAVFLNASDDLYNQLTFGLGLAGFWIPTVIGAGLGAIGGATYAARPRLRRPLILSSGSILVLGAFAGILRVPLLASPLSDVGRAITASGGGLTIAGAIITIGGAIAYDLGEAIGRRYGALRAGQAGAIAGEIIVGTLFATQASLIGSLFEGGTPLFGTVGALIGAPLGLFVGAFVAVGLAKLVQRGVTPRVAALPASRQSFVQMLWRAFMIGLGRGLRALAAPRGRPVLLAGRGTRRALHPDGPGSQHHARPRGPARPRLRGVLRHWRLHRRLADVERRVRHRPLAVLGGRAGSDRRGDAVRRVPGPAHPAHPW